MRVSPKKVLPTSNQEPTCDIIPLFSRLTPTPGLPSQLRIKKKKENKNKKNKWGWSSGGGRIIKGGAFVTTHSVGWLIASVGSHVGR